MSCNLRAKIREKNKSTKFFRTFVPSNVQDMWKDWIIDLVESVRFWALVALLLLAVYGFVVLYEKYDELFCPSKEQPFYDARPPYHDDTLRVAIIGDSWAEFHSHLHGTVDSLFPKRASQMIGVPVQCRIRGKGGAMSKEIYYFMFRELTEEDPMKPDYCTQPLIEWHPDYCVLQAGINDAIFQRGLDYYTEHYRMMLRLLLYNGIRPVAMEMPMVDAASAIDYKTYFKRSAYHLKAYLLGTRGNNVPRYQSALRQMLEETGLKDSVVFIPADSWIPEGWHDTSVFLRDRIHLNLDGYKKLDSVIAVNIAKDWRNRNIRRKEP